ncbi:hypothetical protein C6501_06795 [Candidatus Poribacteria bacterium]|nr:MAG: hypothetical protein C6501_06795 [Candidatus Poribacteria bacterium]
MSKDQVMENEEFLKYWLTHADANSVFEWLREEKPYFTTSEEEIATVLIERDEPLINLGVALYGRRLSNKTLQHLYSNDDRRIKKAALSANFGIPIIVSWAASPEVLGEILNSFDEELLNSLLSNESIDQRLLVFLYKRERYFSNLTDKQWLKAIAFTVSNPRIGTPLDKYPPSLNEFGSYHEVFSTGWKLFETLSVNQETAVVLSHLGENLVPTEPPGMDVFATIKRWEVESEAEEEPLLNAYDRCRFVLAKLIREYSGTEFESLKDSDDLALRSSYYDRFRAKKPEEVRKLFEKDNDKFLNVAIYNTNLYRSEDIREELRKCCFDYEHPPSYIALRSYPASFNAEVERLTKEHPEWFPDFKGDIPFDEVEDPLQQANMRLESLQKQTKVLSKKLIESEFEDEPSLIDEIRIAINDVKTDLSESNRQLELLREDTKILLEKLIGSEYSWESEDKHSLIEKINISIENINTILSESNERLSKVTVLGWVMGGVIIVLLLVLIF